MARFPSISWQQADEHRSHLRVSCCLGASAVVMVIILRIRLFLVHDRGVWEGVKQKRSITGVFATSRTP